MQEYRDPSRAGVRTTCTPPQAKRNWPAIRAALKRCTAHFEKLDRLLAGGPYLLGDAPTLAEITIGTSLDRYFELQIERPPLPQVERWYRTLQARPARTRHDSIRRTARTAGLLNRAKPFQAKLVMPGLVPGIHVLQQERRGWPGRARP